MPTCSSQLSALMLSKCTRRNSKTGCAKTKAFKTRIEKVFQTQRDPVIDRICKLSKTKNKRVREIRVIIMIHWLTRQALPIEVIQFQDCRGLSFKTASRGIFARVTPSQSLRRASGRDSSAAQTPIHLLMKKEIQSCQRKKSSLASN